MGGAWPISRACDPRSPDQDQGRARPSTRRPPGEKTAQLKCPVLAFFGEKDAYIPLDSVEQLQAEAQGASRRKSTIEVSMPVYATRRPDRHGGLAATSASSVAREAAAGWSSRWWPRLQAEFCRERSSKALSARECASSLVGSKRPIARGRCSPAARSRRRHENRGRSRARPTRDEARPGEGRPRAPSVAQLLLGLQMRFARTRADLAAYGTVTPALLRHPRRHLLHLLRRARGEKRDRWHDASECKSGGRHRQPGPHRAPTPGAFRTTPRSLGLELLALSTGCTRPSRPKRRARGT